ncbi:putative ubiquitin-conjugating enzyme E2 23 [Apostasia shenzhenica]|uniref:Putative ubiquitin-conjugating enzyme E2 23 n=1 Tax=Apostasia shenzhenica TaxID=1088818 RepID=A0A2I0AFW0_9ASPA|nr:putative ubiquitin-conjugating enzyme E2 23 [Apostasia shenzhenica]
MDLLRAVIIGSSGTPYHDGVFFFDVCFQHDYPHSPPKVHFRSTGLRLNPNLYESGRVCLSILNTWFGRKDEKWNPKMSTILQVLVSIQGLVLNEKPYFNEPAYARKANTSTGEERSLSYNRKVFRISCKLMLHAMRNPPKHFEDFVAAHFQQRGYNILAACKAYLSGASIGCRREENETMNASISEKTCSSKFDSKLGLLIPELAKEFTHKGLHCSP